MKLSKRLQAVYDFVKVYGNGGAMADIGTDHGYLPCALAMQDVISYAYACDIAKGPLEASQTTIQQLNVESKVRACLGDGLAPVVGENLDVVTICGMGGQLMIEILRHHLHEISFNTLILQPNINEPELRLWLNQHGLKIVDECCVEDIHHFYDIMVVQKGHQYLTEEQMFLGLHPTSNSPAYLKKLRWQKQIRLKILNSIHQSNPKYAKVQKELHMIDVILKEDLMFKKRREQVLEMMEESSVALLYSANNHFFYLTGLDRDHMALVLEKNKDYTKQTLFIPKRDPFFEKWNGKLMDVEEAKAIAQIDDVQFIDDVESTMMRLLDRKSYNHLYFLQDEFNLDHNKGINTLMARRYKDAFPSIQLSNLYPLIGCLRMVKDGVEVSKVKKAVEMTNRGLQEVLKTLKPGLYEYQVQATYEYSIKYQGSIKPSFPTIAGAGYNATMLHYGTNRDLIHDGDMILLDLGSMYEGYCSDITRTYPANGKYTERQKAIYNIVLEANKAVQRAARPGLTPNDLNEICKDVLSEGLISLGIISSKDELINYYMHGVSHHLGLDVHDVTIDQFAALRPGCIISNEPGLYIEEESIGIRIEDDLLITEDGCECLSSDIIKEPEEIEAFMAKHNPFVK